MKTKQDIVTTDRITLEKIQFGIQQMFSPALMDDMRYESVEDIATRFFIKQLTFYLWGNKVNEEEYDDVISVYPATMWEELKEDFAPRWFLRRFPVRYSKDIVHHTSKHFHVCPHLNYKENRKHVEFITLNDVGNLEV